MTIQINQGAIRRLINGRIQEAWAEVVKALDQEFEAVIRDPNEFGDLGFSDQDIVDTERFVDSVKVQVDQGKATWSWDPIAENGYHYATALYFGYLAFGQKYIAGRPWVERAFERVKPLELFQAELRKRGINATIIRKNQIQLP